MVDFIEKFMVCNDLKVGEGFHMTPHRFTMPDDAVTYKVCLDSEGNYSLRCDEPLIQNTSYLFLRLLSGKYTIEKIAEEIDF